MVHDINALLRTYKKSVDRLTLEERVAGMKDVCRAIRATKLHFHKVLERYGADYEEAAQHFVDQAYAASDMASATGNQELIDSLRRHAEEIEAAQKAAKDDAP